MLPKAYLTSHSRMSGSRWVTTPLWLSGSWRYFLYSSSVYFCHLCILFKMLINSQFLKMPFKLVLLSCFRLAMYYLELITSIKKTLRCEISTTVMIFYVTIFTVPSSIDYFLSLILNLSFIIWTLWTQNNFWYFSCGQNFWYIFMDKYGKSNFQTYYIDQTKHLRMK